jgi:MHS family proline/betaine transporter-like MFS transporter
MAPLIGAHFFPSHTTNVTSTQEALIVFAAGFICRPLGGILFGHFGDTRGRAKVLRFSILIIALSTLIVGLLPSYHSIGSTSTLLFIFMRLLQGIAIGGEYSGVMIYLAESSPENRRGFMTSFAAVGANIGFLFATLSFMLLKLFFSEEQISDWAWRIPFIITGLPGALFLYYRFKLKETHVYTELKRRNHIEKNPFSISLRYAPRQLLKILGLTCMSASFYYIFFGYMPYYLEQYIGVPLNDALIMQSILLIAMLFLIPIGGLCGDFFTRKKMIIFVTLGVIIFSLPCFYLFQLHSSFAIMLSLSIATMLSSFDQGNMVTAIVENSPLNIRYSTLAFSYNLGNALFGGTAPIITSLLIKRYGSLMPAYYLIAMATISLIAASTLLGNNKLENRA